MQLPNSEHAIIEPSKLQDYLLSSTHPVGRFKAAVFTSLGYEARKWKKLDADLRSQHLAQSATELPATRFGRKFAIRARLTGPSGRSLELISVWIILAGEDVPRFVTAYP